MLHVHAQHAPVPVYQADAQFCEHIRTARQRLADVCGQCTNRYVRIQTIDGHVYEGTVVGSGGGYLYLSTRNARFFGPFAASILPLVLYELLVISLLF